METDTEISAKDIHEKLLNNDDVSKYLSAFVAQAEKFNAKNSDIDIVKNYLHESANCKEILQLVKGISTADSQVAMLILNSLCHILVRIAKDLYAMYLPVGTAIVNDILDFGMKSVLNFLKIKQKSSRTKLALHLLCSMVALGGQTAHKVASKLDFSSLVFTHLLNRKNFSEEEDIRSTFINLIVLILTTCDFAIIRQLVEVKGFLNDVLHGLESDRPHIITLVLSTFRKLIVESTGISKTTKLKLFNDHSLKPVMKLYTWKGPVKNKKQKKRKLGEEEQLIAYEASEEEVESVQSSAHEFMLALCCSFKTGIIFHDSSFGSSGKNLNHVLTNILTYMPRPHTNKLSSEFVIAVLKTCPDQMVYYLPSMKQSYTPRLSPLWLDAMNVLKKIIAAQDPIACVFKHGEKKSVSSMISIARSLCFPTVIATSVISKTFQDGHPFICYHLCDFFTYILNKIKGLIDFCLQDDYCKTSYSSADIATFHQSFLTTIMQDFTFLKDLGGLWKKLTSSSEENSEEKVDTAMPVPSLSRQLLKILEVIQHIFSLSPRSCQEYDINIPKLFQSLKTCYSVLSREEICSLNLKLVDIISVQGEDVITLWNKNLTDSPLMFLLDVYSTTPHTDMIEDVSRILNKVLVHTKVFEFCPWETGVWLESLKSCRAKHVPFIIEFINEAMCTLLKNPNKFSDDIIETAEQKCNSQISMDVTTVLNDLLSAEKDPILVEDFTETNNVLPTPRLNFSALVPAALFALKSVDDHKRKSCQSYVEKVLYDIMHHQHSPEILFSTTQKYKENLSNSLCDYFELLCSSRYEIQKSWQYFDAVECKEDLREHLKVKFITLHASQNSSSGCHCDIQCDSQNLQWKYKEKFVWQIITYLDWEITLLLEDKIQNTGISNYIHLLEILLCSPSQPSTETDEVMEICESEQAEDESLKFRILDKIVSHPVMLKLFLWTEKVPKSKKSTIQDFVQNITKLLLTVVPQVISQKDSYKCLIGLKDKVVKFNSFYFQVVNLPKNLVIGDNLDISHIISTFSSLLSSSDIIHMLDHLLIVQTEIKLEYYFSILMLVFKMYIELNDFRPLSPNTINLLFEKYMDLSKKQKKVLRQCIIKMFENHPVLASSVNAQSTLVLLKQSSSKNFYILGCFVDCNDNLRRNIQMLAIENLEDLKSTPDFIYLVSKCILNAALDDSSDINFLETVSSPYWKTVSSYLMTDIGSPDTLLENCAAGKALQVLFQQKILAMKKMSKFFKINADALMAVIPCPSKMLIFLQFMEIWKNYISDSNKSFTPILKIAFHWLATAVSSLQSSTEFNYFPLVQFLCGLLQNVEELELQDLVDPDTFFPKVLKIALKGGYNKSHFIETLTLLCKKSNISTVPTETIFNLVTTHSNFFNTMLSQVRENETLKEHVIDLLITLVKADKTLCKDNHLALLLASYTATLKSVDRKLLYLIKLYFESEIDVSKFSLLLWSKTALVYYSVMNSGAMHLEKKPKLQDLLNIFSFEMIEFTVEKYPLTLKLEICGDDSCEELTDYAELDKMYDLRFILPLLANVLSPGSFVHCRNFMDSNILMLIFASLSSYDPDTRALGYYCLSQLYFHLEGANYREKDIWLCLLDSLRNSITSENPRIPSIVSLFLARVTHIFTKPDHPLYTVLYKFIMVKPNLDIGHVPEFYMLFNSLDIEHRVQRMWLLKLLCDGLRSSLDFHICEKRYIFNTLLTHYWSSISTSEEKVAILNVLTSAAKVEASARFLVQNSLLSWLHNVIEETGSTDVAISKSLCRLLKTLWFTVKKFFNTKSSEFFVEDSEENKKNLHGSFCKEFEVNFLKLPERLKFLDLPSVNAYLSTLHDVLSFAKNYDGNGESDFNPPLVSICQLLDCWQVLSGKPLDAKTNDVTQFQEACTLFTKIFLLWSPDWKTSDKQCYRNQQLCVIKSIQLMLKCHDSSLDLPSWLYRCFKEDNSHGLVKLLFSPESESCLKSILVFYEKSLNHQSSFTYCTPRGHSKVSVCNRWRKIFLHFRKTCKSCNLATELNLYNQITMAS